MLIYVDIDETICDYDPAGSKTDYYSARPIEINIDKINKLYEEGNEIVYWTARASVNSHLKEEYQQLTEKQLKEWGAKYHNVIVGEKPAYDLIICDKSRRIEEI
tara:strand:- start:3065 stop:3376 length:312 start_codon:yes stop_codon:yes gene_type:complete